MFLELCFSVMLMMRGGGFQSNAPGSFSVTLNDETEGFQSNAPGAMLFYETAG